MAFYSIHHHSMLSVMDGMGVVADHVARAHELGWPAMALTDHGTMAGVAELYRECRKRGIKPLPGIEAYAAYGPKTRKVFHLGLVAVSEQGYLNLVAINNRMNEDFYYKPVLDLTAIGQLDTEGVIVTTGCYFGVAQSAYRSDPDAALNVVAYLAKHFDVYVEAQAHGITADDGDHDDTEDQAAAIRIADELGLPMVVGLDCHYIAKEDRRLHNTMKRLGSWSDDPDSAVFPGEYGYHMPSEAEAEQWYLPEAWERGTQGLDEILQRADVRIPPMDSFSPVLIKHHSDDRRLRDRVAAFLDDGGLGEEYRRQAEEELAVIEEFGFAGYLLLEAELTDYLRGQDMVYGVRGSAGGSLVCWALGITYIDPLAWDLDFDRFLSRDRAKLPDIDVDVDSARRDDIIKHLRRRYVVQSICSYAELGVRHDKWKEKWVGSALRKWEQAQRKTGGTLVPDETTIDELQDVCNTGAVSTRGTHAAGLVVAPDRESMKYLPVARIGSAQTADRFVTAFDMDSVEALGYVKMDLLGLKMLSAVQHCHDELGIDLESIPLDDKGVFAMIGAGMTDGMFQLEGWAARKGAQRMKPRSIGGIIDAMALFRPATRSSGAQDLYLRRFAAARRGGTTDPAKGLHKDIAEVVRPTYGVLLYQEQLLRILKRLGFQPAELTQAHKAIKASNKKEAAAQKSIAGLKERIRSLASARKWRAKDVQWLDEAFSAYAGYGFNKAHATSYGLFAYQTGWLVRHHPGHYFKGLIDAHAGDADKVEQYMRALRERNFRTMPVDVNRSGVDIRIDPERKRIYPSLTTIDGVGEKWARELEARAPFESIEEMKEALIGSSITGRIPLAQGVHPLECNGVVGALAKSGAMQLLEGWDDLPTPG